MRAATVIRNEIENRQESLERKKARTVRHLEVGSFTMAAEAAEECKKDSYALGWLKWCLSLLEGQTDPSELKPVEAGE